jgi:hypothetical protein
MGWESRAAQRALKKEARGVGAGEAGRAGGGVKGFGGFHVIVRDVGRGQ